MKALTAAIAPALGFTALIAAAPRLVRHLREPPRRRGYQAVSPLF